MATTTSQSFSSTQINSTSKTSTVATIAATATTVDSTKLIVRPHQILSRETSFISKPATISASEEKDEPQLSVVLTTIATAQATQAPQISVSATNSTGTSTTTVTITSKLFHISCKIYFLLHPKKKMKNLKQKFKNR